MLSQPGPAHGLPSISVVIPCHNGAAWLERCLAGVRASAHPALETIVVDDASTDATPAVARNAGARLCALARRGGPARARNLGAERARGEILMFIDSDVVLHADTLGRVVRRFADDPALDALVGSYDDAPAARNFVSQFEGLQHHFIHQNGGERVASFAGCCGAMRRALFLRSGGFDTCYGRPAVEDIALGYRLSAAGATIALDPQVQVTHLKRWTLASLVRTELFDRAVPWTELILDGKGPVGKLNLEARQVASALAPAVLALSAVAATRVPVAVAAGAAATALVAFIGLNWRFYRFLRCRRGLRFAVAAVPLHLLYFVYAAAGLCLGAGRWSWRRLRRGASPAPVAGSAAVVGRLVRAPAERRPLAGG